MSFHPRPRSAPTPDAAAASPADPIIDVDVSDDEDNAPPHPSRLYPMAGSKRPELWRFIDFVAPKGDHPRSKKWKSKECVGDYCRVCKQRLP